MIWGKIMVTNYNIEMKKIIDSLDYVPKLLLHSCCGPCSTEVITRLTPYFDITVLYYNPNIEPKEEYEKRKNEQIRLLEEINHENKLELVDIDWENEEFQKIAEGLELEPEGGSRCHRCYELRLRKTAMVAKVNNYDYFATTLTVSPYKDAQTINLIGKKLEEELGIKYLYSDFKKENGYQKSIEYSKKYKLYRQNYCGCHFSRQIGIEE